MRVTFYPYIPTEAKTCSICLVDIVKGQTDIVAHSDLKGKVATAATKGNEHPYHKVCIRQWAETSSTCPNCNVLFDAENLFSWNERCIRELTCIVKDAWRGAKFGAHPLLETMGETLFTSVAVYVVYSRLLRHADRLISHPAGLEKAATYVHNLGRWTANTVIANLCIGQIKEKKNVNRIALRLFIHIAAMGTAAILSPKVIPKISLLGGTWQVAYVLTMLTTNLTTLHARRLITNDGERGATFADRYSHNFIVALQLTTSAVAAGILGATTNNNTLTAAAAATSLLMIFEVNQNRPLIERVKVACKFGALIGLGVAAGGHAVKLNFDQLGKNATDLQSTIDCVATACAITSLIAAQLGLTGAVLHTAYGIYHRGQLRKLF